MENLDPTQTATTLPEAQQPATPVVADDDEDFLAGKTGYCELGEACESCQ